MILVCNFSVIADIYNHALEDPTVEICGALLGSKSSDTYWHCMEYMRMRNTEISSKAEVYYTPKPEDLFNVLSKTTHMHDDADYDLVGIAHTHPRHHPIPSTTDLNYAGYEGVYYLLSHV